MKDVDPPSCVCRLAHIFSLLSLLSRARVCVCVCRRVQTCIKYVITLYARVVILFLAREQKYGEVQTAEFWCLGLGEPWPISGLHGDGVRKGPGEAIS